MARKGFKVWQELALGVAAVAAIGYGVLALAPFVLAPILPQSLWTKLGEGALLSMTGGAAPCAAADGPRALAALVARLEEGGNALPDVSIDAYSIPVMNAWALPGGRIIVTSELIARADTAEEVAGVLAHEIGHVRELHAETQFVRQLGIGVLSGLGSGGDGFATAFAILRYSRDDEREADAIARDIVEKAAIDPEGLRSFFKRVQAEEPPPFLGKLTNLLETHPMTQERIDAIKPLPEGIVARPVLSGEDWEALKGICG
jgi:beta-barrel assembly-enhancing protease